MHNFSITQEGRLEIQPSAASSKNDFDFLLGDHTVQHKKLKTRLNGCTEWITFEGTHTMQGLLGGISNLEQHFMQTATGEKVEGIALRLFNPATRLWSIHWADSQRGILDVPMTGSFENKMGYFFAKDEWNGLPILVQFKWDATDPKQPVWSQAFSADNGQTWEWNWYMYFKKTSQAITHHATGAIKEGEIGVIELRNYIIKPGRRDEFIEYFETKLVQPQREANGYPLGQFRIGTQPDQFVWWRGFASMEERSRFLPVFYYSPAWKEHRSTVNDMLANNDNVHLLQPLTRADGKLVSGKAISADQLKIREGIAVVDFYTANTKLPRLIELLAKEWLPVWEKEGLTDYTLWIAADKENDFPLLPVFQDKDLLVVIAFYKDEATYRNQQKAISAQTPGQLNTDLLDTITTRHTLILYPTDRTLHV